jgi:hypothetical protein
MKLSIERESCVCVCVCVIRNLRNMVIMKKIYAVGAVFRKPSFRNHSGLVIACH